MSTKYSSDSGFTLIELMVVIAVIAILAVIGISIFSNVQSRARDNARQANINQLAKSIEATKNPSSAAGAYSYTATNYTNDFPGLIIDPQGANYVICYRAGTAQTPAAFTTACPSSGGSGAFTTLISGAGAAGAAFPISTTTGGWTICVAQDNAISGNNYYCKSSTR